VDWKIEIIKEREIIRVIIEGDFTAADHLRMIEDIVSNKVWRPGMDALFDGRKVQFGENGFDLMWHAGINLAKNNSLIGNGKIAILMKASDFILGREFEMLTDEQVSADIRIFMDEGEAMRWLET
jgi:hypothetical protein